MATIYLLLIHQKSKGKWVLWRELDYNLHINSYILHYIMFVRWKHAVLHLGAEQLYNLKQISSRALGFIVLYYYVSSTCVTYAKQARLMYGNPSAIHAHFECAVNGFREIKQQMPLCPHSSFDCLGGRKKTHRHTQAFGATYRIQ